ncbi:MAG: hypothetical protein NTU49_03310 [Gammaproteobacteria bacterium]|nr:hypothetical protein [Gammaproteobacteria bacterium]
MRLYEKTDSRLFLVGYLNAVPDIKMDSRGEFTMTLELACKKPVHDKFNRLYTEEIVLYRVFVTGESALRIKQFGFVGLHLWVEGGFQINKNSLTENIIAEVHAERMSFLNFSESADGNSDIFSAVSCEFLPVIDGKTNNLSGLDRIH